MYDWFIINFYIAMSKYFLFVVLFLVLQSCTANKVIEVKSPCVSTEDGPCGPRKLINTWLKETKTRA